MRVLLVSAPHRDTFGYSMPPPGLLRLGGALERGGIDVALDDLAHALAKGELPEGDALADAACERLLARGAFDVIGMSVMGATLPIALAILERVRKRSPGVRTWIGGPGTTGVDRALVERFAHVDVVVRGEGEITTLELARASDARGIAGTTWRARDGTSVREADRAPIQDLADLPPYAWHLLPSIAEYKRVTGAEDGLVPIDSGRGCVYDCSFCTIGRFWSRRSRVLPAQRLADEIEALASIEGAKSAYLCHDLFGAHRSHALELCRELVARGVRVPFEVRARADHLDRELLDALARAGGYRVLLGIESGAASVRRANQKGMRDDVDLLRVVDDCASAGVTPILSLILGLPGEGDAELAASLDFCADAALRAGVNLSLHLVNPQPGCGLGEEHGAEARAVEGIPPDMALGTGETAAEKALIAAHPDLFSTFALLPQPSERLHGLAEIARELPELLMRYPRTFALLRMRDGDALSTWRRMKASGRSFEAFARARRDPLVDDLLAWEQALVRAGCDDASILARGPRSRAIVVRTSHDVVAASEALREHGEPSRERQGSVLAILPAQGRSPLRGVATVRISSDVAALLGALDGTRTLDELEAERPGIERAVQTLAQSGLVDLVPVRETAAP